MQKDKKNKASFFKRGTVQGYFKGRAKYISSHSPCPLTNHSLKVLLIPSCGKGPGVFINEAIEMTLNSMVKKVILFDYEQSVFQQAMKEEVDVVFVSGAGIVFHNNIVDEIEQLRRCGVCTAIWMTDDPYYTDMTVSISNSFHYVFTNDRSCVELYANEGCSAHYVPLCVYPLHYYPRTDGLLDWKEISFIGVAFQDRIHFFDSIMPQLMCRNTLIKGCHWDRSMYFSTYRDKVKNISLEQWIGPVEMNENYNSAHIVLNVHRSTNDSQINQNQWNKVTAVTPNPRTFEICATGAFQLTDIREDLSLFYTQGVEIETYTSKEELLEKVEHYLQHEEERQAIALRGLERTLKEHTYGHRLNVILSIISRHPEKNKFFG